MALPSRLLVNAGMVYVMILKRRIQICARRIALLENQQNLQAVSGRPRRLLADAGMLPAITLKKLIRTPVQRIAEVKTQKLLKVKDYINARNMPRPRRLSMKIAENKEEP